MRSGDNGIALEKDFIGIKKKKKDTIKKTTLLGLSCTMTLGSISDKANTLRTAKKTDGKKKLYPLGRHWNSEFINSEAVPGLENFICLIAIFVLTFSRL